MSTDPVRPRSHIKTALALVALGIASVLPAIRPTEAAEPDPDANGEVLPLELRCAVLGVRRARLSEGLAIFDLKNIYDDATLAEEAQAAALGHLTDSMRELDAAIESLRALEASPAAGRFAPEFFELAETAIDRIRARDANVFDRLELLLRRSHARNLVRSLELTIEAKDEAMQSMLGAIDPEVPRRRRHAAADPDGVRVPVALGQDADVRYSFDARRVAGTGLRPHEVTAAFSTTARSRVTQPTPSGPAAKQVRPPSHDRFLAFRGRKKSQDGLVYLHVPNYVSGAFQAEFRAGLFRKPGRKHSPDASVTVEFDVVDSEPLDFFLVSTRYVPANKTEGTPSGVQVFTGSKGGTPRGDVFLPGIMTADVRVVHEGGVFQVFARPLGGAEEDFVPVATWNRGDDGAEFLVGVGAARLRRGTELGIDDLVLTPR